jgi:hypothetical protein
MHQRDFAGKDLAGQRFDGRFNLLADTQERNVAFERLRFNPNGR